MRRLFHVLAALWLGCLAAAAPAAAATPLWEQPKYAAILIDANTGQVLYEKRADIARHPASITKVMTLMLAFDAIERGTLRLDDNVEITPHAARQPPSKLGLKVGEVIPVEDAIRIIAVKSANDIAVALAERIAGSEGTFVQLMNSRARELGMRGTNFANASGLPNVNHYTTARDLAQLSMALMQQHAKRYAYFSAHYASWRGATMRNHNRLLGHVPGVDGIKTGFTNASGYTLAASASRFGRRLIAIVLGTPSSAVRNGNVTDLLEAGFSVMDARRWGSTLTVAAALGDGVTPALAVARPDAIGALIGAETGQGDAAPVTAN